MMNINEECLNDLKDFLKEYPDPAVKIITTLYDGFVRVIKPVPTICGAEVYCLENAYDDVKKVIQENTQ